MMSELKGSPTPKTANLTPGSIETARPVRDGNGFSRENGSSMQRLVKMALDEINKIGDIAPHEASPIVSIIDLLIEEAAKRRSSDIHIEAQENGVMVRYRIDGVLRNAHLFPKPLQAPLVSRIKILANLDIAEKRHPQDGRIKAKLSGKRVDVRVSVVPALHGEKVVLRILDVEATSIPLDGIGFSKQVYEGLVSLINQPQGLLYITGPTGSGKSSTLYACIKHIHSEYVNTITIEDPIEYEIEGITQIAVHEKIGLTFADVLRSVLRQDPDVIMVGETRDAETASIAMQASLTGHRVFSTLHTNDSVATVTRLLDMGIPGYLIASSLTGVLAQRLVRVICPECKEPFEPRIEELTQLGLTPDPNLGPFYKGKGCKRCEFTGYYGRTVIAELFIIDEEIRHLLRSSGSESLLKKKAQEKGTKLLLDDGLAKINEGRTTVEEIVRATPAPGKTSAVPGKTPMKLAATEARQIEVTRGNLEVTLARQEAEPREKDEMLRQGDSALEELEKELTARIHNLERQLQKRDELLKEQETRLAALEAQLKEKEELLGQKERDSALEELEKELTARIHNLERQLQKRDELLKEQETRLAALEAQLKEKEELLSRKESAYKELRHRLLDQILVLEQEIRQKGELPESRKAEIADSQPQVSGLSASPEGSVSLWEEDVVVPEEVERPSEQEADRDKPRDAEKREGRAKLKLIEQSMRDHGIRQRAIAKEELPPNQKKSGLVSLLGPACRPGRGAKRRFSPQ